MIHMTTEAHSQIQTVKQKESKDSSWFIRVEVKKGGCSGMNYKLDFDNETRGGDQVFEHNGEKIVVDSNSYLYLIGLTLDFEGGLNGKGFVFQNPNASKTCGCGASFNV